MLIKKIFLQKCIYVPRCVVLFLMIVAVFAAPVDAARIVKYKTYHPVTGKISNQFSSVTRQMPSGKYEVHWIIEEARGSKTEEEYLLDKDFTTIRFKIVNLMDKTNYVGEIINDSLNINGEFKGKKVAHILPLDEHPFYYNPKIGLRAFVYSGEKSWKFWGFQNRELKVYPMKAINQGAKIISVNGHDVEVIQIYWTLDNALSVFFKRIYWFRKSDGLYLKQKVDGGEFRELVSEGSE